MAIQADNIGDLVKGTLKELGRMKWTDIATPLQYYHFMPQILKNYKRSIESGYGIQRNLMVDDSGAAVNAGLWATDSINVVDVMQNISVPWRHTKTHWAMERRELAMNRQSPQKVFDLMKTRRVSSLISLAKKLETDGWSKPTDSTDDVTPFGIAYWIVKNTSSDGFTGGNPSGFTAGAGGLDSATYTRWANWSYRYVNKTKQDLVRQMRQAKVKTNFMSPVKHPAYSDGPGQYVCYCNYTTLQALEEIGEQQNDNLGKDIASMDGEITFRKNPIRYVPQLDSDSDDPVYMINWGAFYPVCLEGEYLKETVQGGDEGLHGQHTVTVTWTDLTWNTICDNRREQAVIFIN